MPCAAHLLLQVNEVKALRPLVLCVKAFLRQKGLGELYTGGLSSYAIFNLVMAHLQAEKAVAAEGKPCFGFLLWSFFHRFGISFDYATQVRPMIRANMVPSSLNRIPETSVCQHVIPIVPILSQAVSIQQGGVVPKSPDWHNDSSPWLLAIDDPQVRTARAIPSPANALIRCRLLV